MHAQILYQTREIHTEKFYGFLCSNFETEKFPLFNLPRKWKNCMMSQYYPWQVYI